MMIDQGQLSIFFQALASLIFFKACGWLSRNPFSPFFQLKERHKSFFCMFQI